MTDDRPSRATWPSTGLPLSVIREEARGLDLVAFEERYAPTFFLMQGGHRGFVAMRTKAGPEPTEGSLDRTDDIVITVLPVRRRAHSENVFVGIGRLDGNDIVIADDTVSKFHAYVKPMPGRVFLLHDAKSRNGTTVEGEPVAARGAGPPAELRSGQTVRFGSVVTTFIDAGGLVTLCRRLA